MGGKQSKSKQGSYNMGGKHSTQADGHAKSEEEGKGSPPAAKRASSSAAATTTESGASSAAATATDPPPKRCDVVVSSTKNPDDVSLAELIRDRLKDVEISVFISSDASSQAEKVAGELLVDAKCVVYVASEEAAKNNVGQDLISLAYISNKPILVVARQSKKDLMGKFIVGMKMTLNQLSWIVFSNTEEDDTNVKTFIQVAQDQISPKSTTTEAEVTPTASIAGRVGRRGARLNTKLKAQSTVRDIGGDDLMIENFWDRNFTEEEVTWAKFEECFKKDYEAQLGGLFDEENIPWLLDMLKSDVFDNAETITKGQFFSVRGDSVERNAFWKVVSQIAVEKYNMREVFNMNSSVRLTAIERLAAFQNPAVVEALLKLLEDEDPNVRAVAAISLGRTGCTDENVVDSLIKLLKDQDRIVRQSACLSLGSMKAVKAIPHIGNIWRNDFISVVRNAARTALENMKIPEAQQVLSVTKILEEEIAALEGSQADV